jgi:hypothetical protein
MDSELRTLPDPRSPHDDFPSPERSAASSPHPDLDSEVATLSNKLISAINHQTNLDDALAATRQELEASQDRLRALEAEKKSHEALVSTKALVPKAEVEAQATELLAKLADEKMKRMSVEKDKKGIEQELENLTTALFEEANQVSPMLHALPIDRSLIVSRWLPPRAESVKRPSDGTSNYEHSSMTPSFCWHPTRSN